jgi:hypothetical protein
MDRDDKDAITGSRGGLTGRSQLGSADRREQVLAGLLAAAAHPGADAAVLVVLGVALALRAAGAAGHQAAFERCANHPDIGFGLAGHDAAGGSADVGAVEAAANAAEQILHPALGEVRVGAAGTGSGAVGARLDTAHEHIEVGDGRRGMRLEHLSDSHVLSWAGIGSANAARPGDASKGSAKYCVSWVTKPSVISMTLSE